MTRAPTIRSDSNRTPFQRWPPGLGSPAARGVPGCDTASAPRGVAVGDPAGRITDPEPVPCRAACLAILRPARDQVVPVRAERGCRPGADAVPLAAIDHEIARRRDQPEERQRVVERA